ncbi:hypothetical protein Fmac_011079 [Flemingia macrophylla]|uniref:Uncharacterized protein n=1 Tax=Flemingia macrophylla TaxID=520843 RepID=A0ABD1MM89_9FABA
MLLDISDKSLYYNLSLQQSFQWYWKGEAWSEQCVEATKRTRKEIKEATGGESKKRACKKGKEAKEEQGGEQEEETTIREQEYKQAKREPQNRESRRKHVKVKEEEERERGEKSRKNRTAKWERAPKEIQGDFKREFNHVRSSIQVRFSAHQTAKPKRRKKQICKEEVSDRLDRLENPSVLLCSSSPRYEGDGLSLYVMTDE